jgi:hypothetical protein
MREQNRLRMFENMVLRGIMGNKEIRVYRRKDKIA